MDNFPEVRVILTVAVAFTRRRWTEDEVRLTAVATLRNALNDLDGLTEAIIDDLESQGIEVERTK